MGPSEDIGAPTSLDILVRRLETYSISIVSFIALVFWLVVGGVVWLIAICFGLLYVIILSVLRIATGFRLYSDQEVLRGIFQFYPRGIRMLQTEFRSLKSLPRDNIGPESTQAGYLARAIHLSTTFIVITALVLYANGAGRLTIVYYVCTIAVVIAAVSLIVTGLVSRISQYKGAQNGQDENSSSAFVRPTFSDKTNKAKT